MTSTVISCVFTVTFIDTIETRWYDRLLLLTARTMSEEETKTTDEQEEETSEEGADTAEATA